MIEEEVDKLRQMELRLSTETIQKAQILDFLDRISSRLPAESLREAFTRMVAAIKEGFELEEKYLEKEAILLEMENELRQYAKKEVEGLLSAKVINLRKNVEQHRQTLKQLSQNRDELNKTRDCLEIDLRNCESVERRRADVALETEESLYSVKSELNNALKEVGFLQRHRKDLELALDAS